MIYAATFWNDPSRLSSLKDYLSWIGWSVTLFGVVLTAVSILVSQRVAVLNSADQLARRQKLEELEAATKPKPLKDRLKACLDEIDPRIIQALAAGQPHSQGVLKPYQLSELQKLAAEPGAGDYISLTVESAVVFMQEGGTGTPAKIELKPALLQ